MSPSPTTPPADPFRAQSILRQQPPSRLNLEDLNEPIPLPPPFAEGGEVVSWHYLYHLCRRRASRLRPRPTLGELMMTTGLSKSTCQRGRDEFEAALGLNYRENKRCSP